MGFGMPLYMGLGFGMTLYMGLGFGITLYMGLGFGMPLYMGLGFERLQGNFIQDPVVLNLWLNHVFCVHYAPIIRVHISEEGPIIWTNHTT